MDKGTFDKENAFGQGQPNEAYARYFDGQSFHNPLVDANSPLLLANVTFEHGCLIHKADKGNGQILDLHGRSWLVSGRGERSGSFSS